MTKAQIADKQRSLNHFTSKYLLGVTPLVPDGVKGPATNRRIMTVKFYLGYGQKRDGSLKPLFIRRLRHPHSRRYSSAELLRAGAERRSHQRAQESEHTFKATKTAGVVFFDGVPCAKWIAEELARIRKAGRWKGHLVSGYRDPVYSESLCQRMCGAPSCPGRCAGRSSNHSGIRKPAGAADVTDYGVFEAECRRLESPLQNKLDARDPVHFSTSGR